MGPMLLLVGALPSATTVPVALMAGALMSAAFPSVPMPMPFPVLLRMPSPLPPTLTLTESHRLSLALDLPLGAEFLFILGEDPLE